MSHKPTSGQEFSKQELIAVWNSGRVSPKECDGLHHQIKRLGAFVWNFIFGQQPLPIGNKKQPGEPKKS